MHSIGMSADNKNFGGKMDIFLKKNQTMTTSIKSSYGVPFIDFPELTKTGLVIDGFSTRLGGVSKGELSSMNLSFYRGDLNENVLENYRRIANALHFDVHNIVTCNQCHTSNVRIVSKEERGSGIFFPRDDAPMDGLITNEPNVVLATSHADCVPLYFLDPVKKVIGLAHSGWKGTVSYIGREVVEKMEESFGCHAEDMIAAIGPSICKDCYEVSEDVATQFKFAFDDKFHNEILERKRNNKYQLDLWKANQIVLMKAGILPKNIITTDICTCCNTKTLFSHRGSGGKRGNMMAFLMLKDTEVSGMSEN